ncbi:DUF7455 domain-containing protein [Kineosporia babensis]|uniref:DUF7455 domain-containing protein n=1 Tax=Kineosporia babensis TaxID=499548 RepID=A0A9X1T224_9ACTN|nr:hypothetical protein [Kineosporia babensis]
MGAAIAQETLTATDRCDRCGARAYVRVTLPGGGELLFCGHHGHAHKEALTAASASIQDESQSLTTTPSTAPEGER